MNEIYRLLRQLISNSFCNKRSGIRPFIILGTGRSGSNFLQTLLDSHPQITVYGELLEFSPKHNRDQWDLIMNNPTQYIQNHFEIHNKAGTRVSGFKIFYNHAQPAYFSGLSNQPTFHHPQMKSMCMERCHFFKNFNQKKLLKKFDKFWGYLKDKKDLHVIHLKRRNMLKMFLSKQIARRTGVYSKTNDAVYLSGLRLKLDYEECLSFFKRQKKDREKYDEFFKSHPKIDVFYEDLSESPVRVLEGIDAFLGVPCQDHVSYFTRQETRRLSDAIVNYDELKQKFQESPWAPFFDE